jgi:hypothetical protein
VICGIPILLIQICIWLAALQGGDGCDGTGDGGERAGDRTPSNNMAKNVLYIIKNFHFNSGDVLYVGSVDTDWYLAGCVPGWGWR